MVLSYNAQENLKTVMKIEQLYKMKILSCCFPFKRGWDLGVEDGSDAHCIKLNCRKLYKIE